MVLNLLMDPVETKSIKNCSIGKELSTLLPCVDPKFGEAAAVFAYEKGINLRGWRDGYKKIANIYYLEDKVAKEARECLQAGDIFGAIKKIEIVEPRFRWVEGLYEYYLDGATAKRFFEGNHKECERVTAALNAAIGRHDKGEGVSERILYEMLMAEKVHAANPDAFDAEMLDALNGIERILLPDNVRSVNQDTFAGINRRLEQKRFKEAPPLPLRL